MVKLTIGEKYDTSTLWCHGWTEGDGSGTGDYYCWDFFDEDCIYLGPDRNGIEPLFEICESPVKEA